MVGYFEEQAVVSYTSYLKAIEVGKIKNIDAEFIPDLTRMVWGEALCL